VLEITFPDHAGRWRPAPGRRTIAWAAPASTLLGRGRPLAPHRGHGAAAPGIGLGRKL